MQYKSRKGIPIFMHVLKNKDLLRGTVAIALPIALQNLISFVVQLADTVMLGLAPGGETLLSASSLANQPFFILSIACFGFSGAATVLSAQYYGKKDYASVRVIFSIVLKAVIIVSLVLGFAALLIPEQVMRLYTADGAVIKHGAEYLRILGYAYFTFGFSNTLVCCLRSVEIVKISVIVNLASLATNVFLNWVLIFGNLGAPALGIQGAAIATLTARLLEFAIICVYVFILEKRLRFRLRDMLSYSGTLARDILKYGSPVLINEVAWAVAISLQAVILGHITYSAGDPVAANSIANTIQQLATIVIFGIANAAAVMVGKAIGEGDTETARQRAGAYKYISYIVGAIACLVILLLRDVAVGFYNIPEATKQLATQMLVVTAFITFFVAQSAIFIVGVFRGAGDTRYCLIMELLCLWGISLPLAFLGAYVFMLPVPFVLALMKLDEPAKAVLCLIHLRRGKWLKVVTRDFSLGEPECTAAETAV